MEKLFTFSNRERQHLQASYDLGMILKKPEVEELVNSLGSRVVRIFNDSQEVYIVPPLKKPELKTLGAALVELATSLDPTPPPARYEIN